jgi:hypothetical protein
MIKTVDFIYFNGNTIPGKLSNGAGIYGIDISVGNSRTPTTIKMDVVSEDGNYGSLLYNQKQKGMREPNLSTLPIYSIDVGRNPAKVSFKNLALTAFDSSHSPESKTAKLTFTDRSIIFDKIQVGILFRHYTEVGFNQYQTRHVKLKYIYVNIPAQCEPCDTFEQGLEYRTLNKPFPANYIADTKLVVDPRNPNNLVQVLRGYFYEHCRAPAWKSEKELGYGGVYDDGGGYIILGREQPRQADCDFPKCDYNFSEFLNAISEMTGLELAGTFAGGYIRNDHFGPYLIRTADKNPHLRKDWDGSVRDVLNNWCDLYQMSYTLSFDGQKLIGLDMSNRTSRRTIDTIADDIKNEPKWKKGYDGNPNGFLVESFKENETIEGTEKKDLITNYSKPPRADTFKRTLYFQERVDVIKPEDVVGGSRYYGRNMSEFYNSIALTKFSETLREVYLAREGCLEALGFRIAAQIHPDQASLLNSMFLSQMMGVSTNIPSQWQTNNTNPNVGGSQAELFQHVMTWLWLGDHVSEDKLNSLCDGQGTQVRAALENNPGWMGQFFEVYIGYYSQQTAQNILTWDQKAAEFMGNWCHFPGGVPNDIHLCDDFTKREVTFKTQPQSDKYKGYHYLPQPFKELLIDDGTPPSHLLNIEARNGGISHLNIGQVSSNHWGTNQKEMDTFLSDPVVKRDHVTGFLDDGFESGVIIDGAGRKMRNRYDQVMSQLDVSAYAPVIATIADTEGLLARATNVGHYITGWSQYLAHQHQMELDDPGKFIKGEKPAIIVVPKGSRNSLKFHNTLTVNTGVYVAENPDSPLAQRLSEAGTITTRIDPKCEEKTYCERSIIEQVCDCSKKLPRPVFNDSTTFGMSNEANNPSFHNYISNKLLIGWAPWYARLNPSYYKMTSIVFPCMGMITGNISKTVNYVHTEGYMNHIYGDFPGFSEGVAYPNDKILKTDLQYIDAKGSIDPIHDPKQGVINTINYSNTYPASALTTLENMHDYNRAHVRLQSSIWPKKSISFDLNGTEYGPLISKGYLNPASGLSSWSINYSAQGVKSSFTFATRPAMLPKKEDVISKIEPRFQAL